MLETITPTKVCSQCKTLKEFSSFNKCKSAKDGLRSNCKECTKKYDDKNIDKKREYYQNNKSTIAEDRLLYRQNNKEKLIVYHGAYYQENKERISDRGSYYYQKNKETIKARGVEYRRTPIGKAVQKNSDHKRRLIKKQGDVNTKQLLELQQGTKTCYWCKCSLKNINVHVDHYNPIKLGGEHTLSNLVVSCPKCNLKKSAKDPIQYANSIGKLL